MGKAFIVLHTKLESISDVVPINSGRSTINVLIGGTSALDKEWREKIAPTLWPMVGVECSISRITVSSQVAEQFWVNGFVPQIGAHVVLGGAEYYEYADKDDVPSSLSINRKRKLLRAISEKPIIWIDNPEQLSELRTLLKWLTGYVDKRTEVPNFKLIAPGDFKRRHITKSFLGLAQFVENLGLPVADTLANVVATKENNLGRDVIFMRATALFWPCFEAVLEEGGIKTFNQLFAHFSEDKLENFALVPSYVLGAMRHLLIDEFQDVSPQIVKWVLVLSRSRKAHAPLSKSPSPSWGEKVKFMTYHGSKGLESQSVVLLEDCHYWGMNPLKNYLYQKAGLGSYDEAQKTESRRLAYVGITRAMEACRWYGVKKDGGAMGSIPKGKPFASIVTEERHAIARQRAAKAK